MTSERIKPILTNNATIHPYGWTEYTVLHNRSDFARSCYKTPDSKKGENKHQHGLSTAAIKKVKLALNMLVYIADDKPIFPDDADCKIFFKVNTTTLTLPSLQIHSDEFIKSKILGPFLKACKYHFGMINYFWKAEKQDNGNIHFHLETDCYMEQNKLRALWNHQLERYGYVSRYSENQKEKHKDGFYYNKQQYKIDFKTKLKSKINYYDQKKAYDKGVSDDWSDPNSITIRSIVNVDNLAAYLCGYLAKKDLYKKDISQDDKKAIQQLEKEKVSFNIIAEKFPHCIKPSVSGKIWDCSSKLKNTGLKIESIEQYKDAFDYMKDNEVERVIYSDHCTTYIKKPEFQKMFPPALIDLVCEHYLYMKHDCCSLTRYSLNLHNEKKIQTIPAPSHSDSGIKEALRNIQEHGRPRKIKIRKQSFGRCRQASLQLRF